MKPKITLMIDSASRPFLLKKSVPTVKEHLKYDGEIEWILHEAILNEKLSNDCIEWARSSKIFNRMVTSEPHGQGMSIGNILKPCKDKYFIHWEDDHIALREIDLNICVKIMEENDDVNQITFHKRGIKSNINGWLKKEVERSGYKLTTSPHWRYISAIWRCSFIKPRWVDFTNSNNSHWQINKELKKPFTITPPADWIIQNLGTYYLGPIDEWAYCKSIGGGFSNRTNKRIKYK
jgi:hypothetical protein